LVPYYYPRVIERVTTAIIDVFNDIRINRFDDDGNVSKIIDVPIVHHYNKNFAQFIRNTSKIKESQHQIPIMGLRLSGMSRDSNRTTQQNYVRTVYDKNRNISLRDRRPSTWKISFTLTLYAENLIDFSQMVENILTYFDPTITLAITEFESVNIERDIILTLEDGISFDFVDEVSREEIQYYQTELKLTATAPLYPPVSAAAIIKHISQNIKMNNRPVGEIVDDGYVGSISDYNKKMGEIVELGSVNNTYTVNKIISASDNYMRVEITAVSSPISELVRIPTGSTVVYVEVYVADSFNSLESTLSIGIEGNTGRFMMASENNLYFPAKYAISMEDKLNIDTPINIYFNKGSCTQGTAYITIAWR